ncbi:homoserine dehydrogenase [Glutamicibacter soli]|uniref:Homoserine dehydrogenase n=1 Tax=Glutamicibacter soli TaxID=453836 RepID=A0A365Y9R8_9MICC|nr:MULTISPECIES: homoserine dehydrogenase [Micrococcaceae]ALQ31184.1 homoserine dehydrogenase [Arthrobacter sp. YC-RL1]KLI87555.1 homoserine dehydrogenase [Arthrobacter sp. YC-RL1]RBL99430.1 homoserine dehydrogenase [Glutamicibacter soli]RKS19342.1 homoserine dehydrogenase [Arthrobacter sp. AG1021]
MTAEKSLKVALLGCGTVGAQVARILLEDAAALADRSGAALELTGIAVRNTASERDVQLPAELFTTDANSLIDQADVVIELLGGLHPAGDYIARALKRGASVITGNKALIAAQGAQLNQLAAEHGAQLRYEAAVAGAIPILRPIADSLAGDHITKVMGIVNGTTNFILDAMDSTGAAFDDVLAQAQALGYAEADPTADVGGHDAAAKAAILASLAFHTTVSSDQVHTEGITEVSAQDVAAAAEAGYVIKLLAIAEHAEAGVSVRVYPSLIKRSHPLASVRGAFNAVFVEAENAGDLMFYGAGAGGNPTASAVMGDVVAVARQLAAGAGLPNGSADQPVNLLDFEQITTSYWIGLSVKDQPGVLASIAAVFGEHGVSIESMSQHSDADGEGSALRILTHRGAEAALRTTVDAVAALDAVHSVTSVMRVEGN